MISDVLLDPAGVIYEGEKALPVDAVDRLRRTRNLEAFRHLGLHARRTAFAATCGCLLLAQNGHASPSAEISAIGGKADMTRTSRYVGNKHYGTLNWGLTATPKYDITKNALEYISTVKGEGGGLSDSLVSDFRMNPSFRLSPTGFDNAEGLSRLTWSNIARC